MIPTYLQALRELDKRLCPKYVILCATFSAILSTKGMPTNLPTTFEPIYTTTRLDTDGVFDDPVCRSMSTGSNSSSFLCRPRGDKCDVPEYCSTDGSCPPNVYLADRTPCDFNDGICYQGVCHLTNSPCGAFLAHTFPSESVTSKSNGSYVPDPVVCHSREICVDGQCLPIGNIETVPCPSSEDGRKCSGHGHCTNNNECVCRCGWAGLACELSRNESLSDIKPATIDQSAWCLPGETDSVVTGIAFPSEESRSTLPGGVSEENEFDEMAAASYLANAIIGGSIALMFAVAVVFGATSIGFRKARKKDRLRTLHQFRIMSIFQPTKAQQRKLMKQNRPRYSKPYRERRNDVTKNKDQRIILEPDSNYHNHGNNKEKGHHKGRPAKTKKGNVLKLSETMV